MEVIRDLTFPHLPSDSFMHLFKGVRFKQELVYL